MRDLKTWLTFSLVKTRRPEIFDIYNYIFICPWFFHLQSNKNSRTWLAGLAEPRAWTRIVTSASEIYVSHTNVATLTRVILWGWGSEQENSAIQFTVYCIHICIKTKRHAVSRFQIRLAIAIKIWWKLRKSAARLRRGRLHSFDTCTGHITNLVTGRRHSRKNSFFVEAFSTDHSWVQRLHQS